MVLSAVCVGGVSGVASLIKFIQLEDVDIQATVKAGKPFSDSHFPASKDSLFQKQSQLPEGQSKLWQSIQWARPKQFMGDDFEVFDKDISPNDII